MKKVIKQYFTFSKRDAIAAIIIVLLFSSFIVLPQFFSYKKEKKVADQVVVSQIAALQKQKEDKGYYKKNNSNDNNWEQTSFNSSNTNIVVGSLFQFDPNTLDANGWQKLGLRDKTINTILNYRSKGGKFKQPEDLRKIWGLRKEEADRIIPFAKIENSAVPSGYKTYAQNGISQNQKPVLFDANTVTPEQLRLIPNIGNSLPYKIVSFREKLGGFLNMLQVKETYGMTDSVFNSLLPYLHVLPTEIRKLNINTASEYELNAHPYIDKTLAKAITIYRNQHGGYKSVNDIRKIVFITEDVYNKIAPYLTVLPE